MTNLQHTASSRFAVVRFASSFSDILSLSLALSKYKHTDREPSVLQLGCVLSGSKGTQERYNPR
jgi:hypothetical protein